MRDWHKTKQPPRGTAMRRWASLGSSEACQRRRWRWWTKFREKAVRHIVSFLSAYIPAQVDCVSCKTRSTGSLYRCRKIASLTCNLLLALVPCSILLQTSEQLIEMPQSKVQKIQVERRASPDTVFSFCDFINEHTSPLSCCRPQARSDSMLGFRDWFRICVDLAGVDTSAPCRAALEQTGMVLALILR